MTTAAQQAPAKPRSGGGRPAKYQLADGTVVPGVTTVLKYKDPGALMHWAWKCGVDGKDFRQMRDEAGTVGHAVHAMIEAEIHGQSAPTLPPDLAPDMLEKIDRGFQAFADWRKMVDLEIIATETPLVSELHRFGGTFDCVALVKGVPMLGDWKTGGGVYPEVIAQLAAYRQLIRESTGRARERAPEGAFCLRVGKEFGDFHSHLYTREILDLGWERFLGAQMMFTADKSLSKVCQ